MHEKTALPLHYSCVRVRVCVRERERHKVGRQCKFTAVEKGAQEENANTKPTLR